MEIPRSNWQESNSNIFSKYHHFEYRNPEGKYLPSPDRHIFESLQELMDFLKEYDTSGFYYRGQNALWPLVSSLYRHDNTKLWEQAQTIFQSVGEWIIKNPLTATIVKSNNDALAIAQHYGCPTDLIDITSDMETAAYFASSDDGEGYGCIWVFTPHDFGFVENAFRVMKESNDLSAETYTSLNENNWNLLIEVDIAELSRLNAQQGAFLWDLGGIIQSILRTIGFGMRFVFKHNPNENDFLHENLKHRLFPLPNSLETEILRVLTEKRREGSLPVFDGLSDKVYQRKIGKDWMENAVKNSVFQTQMVDLNFDELDKFSPSCGKYTWPNMNFQNNNRIASVDSLRPLIKIENVNQQSIEFGVSKTIEGYLDGLSVLINVVVAERGLLFEEKFIYDTIIRLFNYGYQKNEISTVLYECINLKLHLLKLQIAISINPNYIQGIISDKIKYPLERLYGHTIILSDDNYYKVWAYFEKDLLKIAIFDGHISSRFYLPTDTDFLDDVCRTEFCSFCRTNNFDTLSFNEDFWVFTFQSDPKKIISFNSIKQLFIKYALPHQLIFMSTHNQILIPNFIERMTIFGTMEHPLLILPD